MARHWRSRVVNSETTLGYKRETPTEAQRIHARSGALYQRGDMILIWVSEADFWNLSLSGVELKEELA